MKVLIAGFDLFGEVGGGQTYYQSIIRRNPTIEFHYFRFREARNAQRPANAKAFDYCEWIDGGNWQGRFELQVPVWAFGLFVPAYNMARSLAGESYDVVELPDYYPFGSMLRPAFRQFDVKIGQIVLSMHGTISTSVALNWWADGTPILWRQQMERMQYEAVDKRYFISEFYRDEWQAISTQPTHYFDPLYFFDLPEPRAFVAQPERPVLRFIGRIEKRKGPHLAINLAWWLPCDSFDRIELIGPESRNDDGDSAEPIVAQMIRERRLPGRIIPSQTQDELAHGFASRSVTLVPSTYDSLNLVALESLFAGCPTVVGSGAGVCRYLRKRFPELPFVYFDVKAFYPSVAKVEALLRDYDGRRAELNAALKCVDRRPAGPTLADIYQAKSARDPATDALASRWYTALLNILHETPEPLRRAA